MNEFFLREYQAQVIKHVDMNVRYDDDDPISRLDMAKMLFDVMDQLNEKGLIKKKPFKLPHLRAEAVTAMVWMFDKGLFKLSETIDYRYDLKR